MDMEPSPALQPPGGAIRWSLPRKGLFVAWCWLQVGLVSLTLRRKPLPEAVRRLGEVRRRSGGQRLAPRRLGWMVGRAFLVGPYQPRCLLRALVLFRELRRQGEPAELVIGLPRELVDKDAHAWVEIDGVDVGPPPGRGHHEPLARYA